MSHVRLLASLLVLTAASSGPVRSQSLTIPLYVTNNYGDYDTLVFGVNISATACIDAALGENELPPAPPSFSFDSRFIDPSVPPPCCCMGQGSLADYREVVAPAQVDTYLVKVQAGYDGGPLTLSWPDLSTSFSGTIVLEPVGFPPSSSIDMKSQTSWTGPTGMSMLSCRIIAQSPVLTAIGAEPTLPSAWTLAQNYPNPFNPSTRIEYGLPAQAHVVLNVCDELGRPVATLVDEVRPAGWHRAEFNPRGLPAGVYYSRLTVGTFSAVRKMLFVK